MSLSKETQEYHLTPRGWEEGSIYGDVLGGQSIVPVPNDRLMTVACTDELSSAFSQPNFHDHVSWKSTDKKSVGRAVKKFGDRPKQWFGYK